MADDHSPPAPSSVRLRRWTRAFNPVVVVAAVLPLGPLVAGEDPSAGPGALLAIACWLVFAVDFGVRTRLTDGFLATWKGRLYLAIVVVTFPVYLLVPGLEETDLLAITRLGWIAVLALAGAESARDVRRLVGRVGLAGLYAAAAVLIAAIVVNRVEEADDGFANFGDGLWWAVATITTVGYGDRVPVTTSGRIVATLLMFSGLAFLGVVAASLAAFFGFGDAADDRPASTGDSCRLDEIVHELRVLRTEIAQLRAEIGPRREGPE